MARGSIKRCEVKDCVKVLGPGASVVGYEVDGKEYSLKMCFDHTQQITRAPRGTWTITVGREIKPLSTTFFIKRGFR